MPRPPRRPLLAALLFATACDSGPEPERLRLSGLYETPVQTGREQTGVLLRLAPDGDGPMSSVDGACSLSVFDGGLGCRGGCTMDAPVRVSESGRARFTLRTDAGDPAAEGTAVATFDLEVRGTGEQLAGTVDARCDLPDRTLRRSATPVVLERSTTAR